MRRLTPPLTSSPTVQDDGVEAPACAESGVLANVVMRAGRAVGTLGHEEEMRRLRRLLIPKQVRGVRLASLLELSHCGA